MKNIYIYIKFIFDTNKMEISLPREKNKTEY